MSPLVIVKSDDASMHEAWCIIDTRYWTVVSVRIGGIERRWWQDRDKAQLVADTIYSVSGE